MESMFPFLTEVWFEHQLEFMALDEAREIYELPFHRVNDVVVEGFFDGIYDFLPKGFLGFWLAVQLKIAVEKIFW